MKQKGAELWQQQEEIQDIDQRDIQEHTLYLADSRAWAEYVSGSAVEKTAVLPRRCRHQTGK